MSEEPQVVEKVVIEKEGNSDLETTAVAGVVGFVLGGPVGGFFGAASGAMYNVLKRELKK